MEDDIVSSKTALRPETPPIARSDTPPLLLPISQTPPGTPPGSPGLTSAPKDGGGIKPQERDLNLASPSLASPRNIEALECALGKADEVSPMKIKLSNS